MKVGDKVFVRKPANFEEGLFWHPEMDKYDGTIQEVSEVYRFTLYVDSEYTLSKQWVTPVFEHNGKYYRIADKGDIGNRVHASDVSELTAIQCFFTFTLTGIKLEEFPFTADGEHWKYALIEITEKPADKLEKGDMENYIVTSSDNPDKIIEDHVGNEGIWCDTYEEKYALLSYLSDKGYTWMSGYSIHEYNWKPFHDYKKIRYTNTGLIQIQGRKNAPLFSSFPQYAEIMSKYSPGEAETTAKTPVEAAQEPKIFDLVTPKLDCSFSDSKEVATVAYIPAMQVVWDNPVTTCEKTEQTHLTKDEADVKSRVTSGIYNDLHCKTILSGEIAFDPLIMTRIYDKKSSKEIINPAASAAKPQKESKMALFSLASKKVRGLAYGALDWAFISPLKWTFKPVATIAQFSVCYLTLAAAGYFAYGLYQNPQSVVEWISELSPVEIRLKNSEE